METLCPSATKLTGTTTVWAKPGYGQQLRDMAATMPGVSPCSPSAAVQIIQLGHAAGARTVLLQHDVQQSVLVRAGLFTDTLLTHAAGPIRAEPGNRYYELAANGQEVK